MSSHYPTGEPTRILLSYPPEDSLPLRLVVFAGVHGNEPSGVWALQRVANHLVNDKIPLQGRVVGLLGNQKAFRQRVRYCQEDLNRLFLPEYLEQAHSLPTGPTDEARELREILEQVEHCEHHAQGQPFFVDCHTTSSASIPYISLNEGYADSFHFTHHMPATRVLGVEKEIKGCLAEWLNLRGWHGFTFEAGQHDAPIAVDNQEAIIWLSLLYSGALREEHATNHLNRAQSILHQQGSQQENVYRTLSSFRINEGDSFRMEPGFVNLQSVSEGQRLAILNDQPVYAPFNGHILMPLYQKQGDFGFFMAQEISHQAALSN